MRCIFCKKKFLARTR